MDSGEQLQEKLQHAVNAMMEKIEKDKIRPIQAKTHRKIAECFSNTTASNTQVEACANNCFVPLQNVQATVQREMNQFQDRLTRCSMSCQDEVRDKFSSSQDSAGAQRVMMNCMSGCVEKHIVLLKSIQGSLEKDIENLSKQI